MKITNSITGAELSLCRTWRYALWRQWEEQGDTNSVMFIGLNPSTADEVEDDTTISKCIGFARRWGYGGIYMLNLFAYRATDWKLMIAASDPVGSENDKALADYGSRTTLVIAAWGGVISIRDRRRLQWESRVSQVLKCVGKSVHCLGKTKDGSPLHPCRFGYARERQLFWTPGN